MGLEHGMLMQLPQESLERELAAAQSRWAEHVWLEKARMAEGLETDMERFLRGGEVVD